MKQSCADNFAMQTFVPEAEETDIRGRRAQRLIVHLLQALCSLVVELGQGGSNRYTRPENLLQQAFFCLCIPILLDPLREGLLPTELHNLVSQQSSCSVLIQENILISLAGQGSDVGGGCDKIESFPFYMTT